MSTIKVKDLVKVYGGRTVVNEVSLEMSDGEIVGLLGPNGAGKTTTFNMIVGIIRPKRGQIFLDDVDITNMPMYKRSRLGVGYLAQEPSAFRKLTVRQNVMGILECLSYGKRERERLCENVIEDMGLTHLENNYAYTLSGGERRRVEIARALVTEPKFILLDEPFSGVDPKAVEELQVVIHQMKERGLGVLITDHSARETLSVTDRSYIIHEGKVMISGTAEELVNNPRAKELYFGESFYMHLDAHRASGFQKDAAKEAAGDREKEETVSR
ncbi:MAG: LPS export ABC transporter ATP-binding protein [Candidatus Sumerlaeia bacterium]